MDLHCLSWISYLCAQLVDLCTIHPNKVGNSSAHPNKVGNSSAHPNKVCNSSAHRNKVVNPSAHRNKVVNPSAHRNKVVSSSAHRNKVVNPSAHSKKVVNPSAHPKKVVNPSAHPKKVVNPSAHPKKVVNPSAHSEKVVNPSLHPNKVVNPLPDDVIIEILLRLPAQCVVQCRSVCRQWRASTSTPYFVELHLKRARQSLLVQGNYPARDGEKSEVFIFEPEEAMYTKIPFNSLTITKDKPRICSSCNGLVVLRTMGEIDMFVIVNFITREELALTPPNGPKGDISGFFFNPLTKDYELLYWHRAENYCNYFIYGLAAKMWRKITYYSYWPECGTPVILNGHLHWMVTNELGNPTFPNSILVYSMESEDFRILPCPGRERTSELRPGAELLVVKEKLSFCCMRSDHKELDIWVLEDYINRSWILRHRLNLHAIISRCPSFISPPSDSPLPMIALLGIHNDEVVFDWWGQGLVFFDLKLWIVREIRGGGLSWVGGRRCYFMHYTKSLVKMK